MDHDELREASRDHTDLLMAQNNALKAGEGALASLCDRQSERIEELEKALRQLLSPGRWSPAYGEAMAGLASLDELADWRELLDADRTRR